MADLIEALQIFSKYCDPNDYLINCDHDILRVCIDPDLVSQKDKNELKNLGFNIDSDLYCFYSYRHGSC